jgi:asparagine synthase (glutamine-hydrolysing)
VLGDPGSPVFEVFDRDWVRRTAALDPAAVVAAVRTGLERVLDFHHWTELYRPALSLS